MDLHARPVENSASFSPETVWRSVCSVRERSPLVHSITNFVVMNSTANALLSAGASPIMAHAPEEMDDLVRLAGALVLNIGTLSTPWIESMLLAGRCARLHAVPVVVDPVGAGASCLRTETALRLLNEASPAVVRGNPGEIMALCGADGTTKGVDSLSAAQDAQGAVMELAKRHNCVVSASGEEDIVAEPGRMVRVKGGSALMPRVTGMGCTASVIVAAHVAVAPDPFSGTVCGMAVMAVAGGMAAHRAAGPGSFQVQFLDALYSMTEADILAHVEIM